MLSSDADPEQATFSVVTVNGSINGQIHLLAEIQPTCHSPTKFHDGVLRDCNVPSYTQGNIDLRRYAESISYRYTSTTRAAPRHSTLNP